MAIKFRRKRFFWVRLTAFLLIVAACGVGFVWNGVIEDFTNRQIFGNEQPPTTLSGNGMYVHFIDVGQGDAAVITFPCDSVIIVDAGGTSNASRQAFSDYLRTHIFPNTTNASQRVVTYFIATHSHADHIGAGVYLFQNYTVQNVVRPKSFTQAEINNNFHNSYIHPSTGNPISNAMVHDTLTFRNFINAMNESVNNNITNSVTIPYRGKEIGASIIGAEIQFLSPYGYNFNAGLNRLSTIFTITFQNRTIMFTGDSYVACENDMLDSLPFGVTLSVDILDVSHHGSTTSTSQRFIDHIQPTYAIIQVGSNNFGHPHNSIIRRLENANATIFTTRQVGDIVVRVDALTGQIEINGAISPGEWFSYWMIVIMVVTISFGALLAMDFFTKGNRQNNTRKTKTKRARR